MKHPHIRSEAQNKHKKYKNLISRILKRSKNSYFAIFFQENIKDLKNTWKRTKNINSLKSSNQTSNAIIDNNATLTDLFTIASAFNKCFTTIGLDVQSSIRYSKEKMFFYFLIPTKNDSFFISSIDCNEVSNIISSLNNHKTVEPNNISSKIPKLLNKDISNQLASVFNLSLSSGIFPNILKSRKIIPIYKKDSK